MRSLFLIVLVCLYLNPALVFAEATLYVSPEAGVYTIGEIFDIKILADTGGQKINAAEAELTFNPGALEVQKILTEDSILESWPTPPSFSNEKGTMRFSGWTKNNFSGSSGLLVTIRFKALHNMSSNAYLAAGAILSADSQGSNIITSMKSGLYSVEPKHVDASQEPSDVAIVGEQISGTTTDAAMQLTQTGNTLETPVFEKESIVINVGERIVINGTGAPNSKILFFLSKGEGSEKYSAVTSDSDGSFTYISDQGSREGVYRLRAAVQDTDGQISKSARITITVRAHGLGAAVGVTTDLLSAIAPLIMILVLAGLGAGYLYHLHAIEKMKHKRIHR